MSRTTRCTLGGVAHILTGIFIMLAATVRTLSTMPVRLRSLMQENVATMQQPANDGADGATPADD